MPPAAPNREMTRATCWSGSEQRTGAGGLRLGCEKKAGWQADRIHSLQVNKFRQYGRSFPSRWVPGLRLTAKSAGRIPVLCSRPNGIGRSRVLFAGMRKGGGGGGLRLLLINESYPCPFFFSLPRTQINFTVAIDFTASNGESFGKHAFGGLCRGGALDRLLTSGRDPVCRRGSKVEFFECWILKKKIKKSWVHSTQREIFFAFLIIISYSKWKPQIHHLKKFKYCINQKIWLKIVHILL